MLAAYSDAEVERVAVRDAHERLRELERRDAELQARRADVQRKADYLRHVVQEIERAAPRVGEDETLETEAKRLAHADELGRLARELEQVLETTGRARAAKLVAGLERLDPSVGKWRDLLDAAFANVEELAQATREYAAGIEGDPGRLAGLEQRRDVLFRLTQKYGPTLPDVLATRDRSAHELDLLDTADLDLRQIADQREAAAAEFARAGTALSEKRKRGAGRLGQAVNELLPALGMPGGRFAVRLQPRTAHHALRAEDVTSEVQLNVGMEPRPLAKVASGGELSRLMLALKVVVAEHDALASLVFDGVDQGIGRGVEGGVGGAGRDGAPGAAGANGCAGPPGRPADPSA